MEGFRLFNSNSTFGDKHHLIWDYAEVIDIDDPYDAGRIRVRIPYVDKDTELSKQLLPVKDGGLPWCEPLLPKYINVVPQVGQLVKIIVFDTKDKKIRRQYVGPIITQQNPNSFLDPKYDITKTQVEFSAYAGKWSANPGVGIEDWKIYPDKNDIAFLGKKNTDIILRNNSFFDEIQIRAGKINPNTLNNPPLLSLNTTNPGYITVNFTEASGLQQEGISNQYKFLNLQKDRSHVNIVADHINFISHLTGDQPKILQGKNITQQIDVENSKLHPVVYGDVLWEFMSLMRNYVESHIHKGSRREPDGDKNKNELVKWFNDNMGVASSKPTSNGKDTYIDIDNCKFLSKGVRTN